MKEYSICYSLDSKYTEQLSASIASVLTNSNTKETFNFFILDGGLSDKDKSNIELLKNIKKFNIEYIQMKNEDFSSCPLLRDRNKDYSDYHVTLPTYYRFLLPQILPKQQKVLYLDCDVIINGSLSDLFEEDIENHSVLMVLDAESKREALRLGTKKYYNAGVMLINLDYWRKHDITSKLFDYAKNNREKILWQDQDIINAVLKNSILEASTEWNYQYFQYEQPDASTTANAKILHLAGRFKPWLMPFESEIYEKYYEYLNLTAFKNRITEYRLNASGKRLKDNIGGNVTNIVITATDEDVNKCWSEISKNYSYVDEQVAFSNAQNDSKISKVYDEISKNYKYIDDKAEETKNEVKYQVEGLINQNSATLDEKYSLFDRLFTEKIDNIAVQASTKIDKVYSDTDLKIQNEILKANSQTDDKLSSVYDEITKNYKYTDERTDNLKENIEQIKSLTDEKINSLSQQLTVETDNKISSVYDEITKNYKYTDERADNLKENIEQIKSLTDEKINSLSQQLTNETDDKLSSVYDEITKNYKYTDERADNLKENIEQVKSFTDEKINSLSQQLTSETDSKINSLSQQLTNETDSKINSLSQQLTNETDSKISSVYDEISKNYKYTDERADNLKENIEQVKSFTDEKINSLSQQLTVETDNKISSVYDEITKNYKYTDERADNLKENIEQVKSFTDEKINSISQQLTVETDNKISSVYDEVSRNYKYTEYLVQVAEEKQNHFRNETTESLNNYINEVRVNSENNINKVYSTVTDDTNAKIDNLSRDFDKKMNGLSVDLTKETDLKFSEIYSYTNAHASNLYKEVKNSSIAVETNLNNKITDLYKTNDEVNTKINELKSEVSKLPVTSDINSMGENLKQIIDEKSMNHEKEVNSLKNNFDEKINAQRIKYEKKLMLLENQIQEMNLLINELQKSPLTKFMEKFRKKKQ